MVTLRPSTTMTLACGFRDQATLHHSNIEIIASTLSDTNAILAIRKILKIMLTARLIRALVNDTLRISRRYDTSFPEYHSAFSSILSLSKLYNFQNSRLAISP